jgi:1,4-dihydroxy-2-naphthoate octaprenyltransferase
MSSQARTMLNAQFVALFGPMRAPFLLLVPACLALSWAAAINDGAVPAPRDLSLLLLGALAAHVSVNALNEYEDFRSGLDLLTEKTPFSGGSGTLPAQPLRAHYALWVAVLALSLTTLVGLYFIWLRGWALLPIGLLGVALILFYTRWLTRSPLLCLIAPGMGFGPLMVVGGYFALTGHFSQTAVLSSLPALFLVSGLLLMNQFPDQSADQSVGRKHLLIVHGPRAGLWAYAALQVLTYLCIILGVVAAGLSPWVLLSLATLPLAVQSTRGLWQHYADTPALIPAMGKNVVLTLVTPLLFALGLALGA